MSEKNIYEIMHMDRRVAKINDSGQCKIYYKSFMPYNLYLEEAEDIDTLVNNITNFNYWCATRILTLDRKYAKEILLFIKQSVILFSLATFTDCSILKRMRCC